MRVLDVKGNTEAENESPGKWKGHITASIAAPLERTWQIGSDFSGLHKFVPIIEVCERLKGRNRTPGCLRFYTMNSATGLPGGKRKAWAKDRLLNIDEETHSYTYAVEGSNMHLENCKISFKASDGKDGTIVKWGWELDPIQKSTKEKTLSDMSEFGCTFIKGLEAAAAVADAIDFDFEGAPPETHSGDDEDGCRHVHPVLSLMKSRLETLTQSLNNISQKLEDGPIPPDLYSSELENLQSILAEGRRSLASHMPGYNSDSRACENKSLGTTAESHEDYIQSTIETISPPRDASTGKIDHEACYRKCVDAISRLRLSDDKGKAIRTLDGGQCQASSAAMFPPLGSKEEELLLEMDTASRGAYEAFQDFSNQFHNDLRDDISHQLESVEARLDFMSSGLKDGDFQSPKSRSDEENSGGHESPQTATQRSYPDARWSPSPPSDGANVCCLRCRNPEHNPEQFEDWEIEKLQCGRLQGSPKDIHSVRARSGLLFRDLLQEEMSQDSDNAAHHGANSSLATFEVTNSPRNSKATMGCAPCCLTQRLAGQRSPPSNNSKVTNVPREYHQPQLQGKESGRFESGPPLKDDNTHVQGGLDAEDLRDLNELETQRRLYQGLKMDHGASEIRRRTLGPEGHRKSLTALILDDRSSQEFQSSEESGEGFQQLQDSIQGWKQRGSNMRLENDLRCLQSTENKLQECGNDKSGSGEFHKNDGLRRPSRLPTDIWPDFLPGEVGREGHLVVEEQGEDSTRRKNKDYDLENFEVRREEFHGSSPIERTRTIVREPASLSSSSSSSQSSKNYKKFIELQSLPAKFSSSGESLPQTVAGGSRNHTTSHISSLDEISSTNSSVAGSHSGHLNQQSQCPLCALHSLGQCAQHVILDLSNEIAPGVFHCRQGKQTRVIIDIPGDLEARQASKRHLRSLLRKVEIYKEFALLGIQQPPTEEKLLADFASARYKEQGAISESETPIYQPYYAHGRVFPPDAGPSPTNVDKSRSKHPGAYPSSSHPTKSKSPSGQNAGHSPETQTVTSKNVTSQRRPPNRIIERRPQSEQPFHVTNSFHKDERYITSEGLRGETTARELAGADHSKRTKPPRGGLHPYPGSQPRAQSAEGSTCRHSFPLQQKREIPIKGNGRRTSHVRQPSSSKGEAKPNAGVSSSIASSHVQPSSSQGKPKTKSGVSTWTENSSHNPKTGSGDRAYGEYTSMSSGDSFVHQELVDEIPSDFSTGPEIGPEIRIYSQARNLLKINTPGIAIHTRDAQQPEGSPRPSSDGSMAKILINFPRDSGDARLLELTHYRAPTSRQGSLEQVVNNVPSESESFEFDPYKPGGKFGSINGSTGSDSNSGLPFSRQLHIGDVHQHTTPTTDQPPNLPNSLTLLRFDQTEEIEQPNTIDSLMYLDEHLVEGKGILNAMVSSSGRCHGCPLGELKREVDQLIQTSESGSPCSMSPELSVRVSWADQDSRQSPLSSRAEGKEESEGTPPPGKINALREVLSSNMLEGLKRLERGDFLPQPTRSHLLDKVSGELDAKLRKSFHNTETQTEMETAQHTQTAGMEPRLEGLSSSQDTQASTEPEDGGLKALQYSQILDSMASSAAESTDDLKAQTHKLDEMVQQSGDVGLISIWNAKKKRKAEALAVRTRSTVTMLNSAINVKEFTEDSRSYSTWLDGVAHEAATQTPHGNAPQTQSFETQASRNLSESSASSEEVPRREPRFREDSAANFLGSVAGQILHEFSDAQKTDADAQDQLKDPQEPRFREDSAANFLSAISQKIVQEFTDYTPNQTPILDQSEVVPRERRFREQSALKFLEALSGQLLPEFKNRSGTRAAETSQAGGAARFREASAINFLDALRDLVLRTPDQNSVTMSEVPSSIDQTVKSEASQSMPGLKKELNLIEDLASHPHPEGKAYPTKGLNYQPESESQGFLGNDLSSQPESESNGFLGEGSSSQPELESDGFPDDVLSYQPESDSHGFPGEGSSSQREWESLGFPGEGSSSQPESGSHGFPGQGLSSQHESESHGFLDEGLSSQPESESHGFLDEGLSSQPESEGLGSLDGAWSSQPQPESEGQGFPDEGLCYQPESEGQGFPDEGLCYQPESEGQGYPDEGLSYQPESEGQEFPDEGLSYQPDPEGDPGDIVGSQPDGSTNTTTDQESQNQLLSESHRFQAQLGAMGPSMGPQGSRRSSQVAVLNEMLQDLHATVSRSRQNSVSNPKGS